MALEEAIVERRRIQELAADPSPEAQKEKEWLLHDAEDALLRVRLIADLIVGAFFAADKDKERKKELGRRLQSVTEWLKAGGREIPDELLEMQMAIRERIPVFHWMIEFPEVFYAERPDPLDGGRPNGSAWMDAFVGNPPFAGKNTISDFWGPLYIPWLLATYPDSHGNADLSAFFFRRSAALLGSHGALGLIATNTISQGDTRNTALKPLSREGFHISEGISSMSWPGAAGVSVSVVVMVKGITSPGGIHLDGIQVPVINSRLNPVPEREDPSNLLPNKGLCSQGCIVQGIGFVLEPVEREALVAVQPINAERLFPYIGGEEVNSNPDQSYDRYIIHFGAMSLEEASNWPDLLAIVQDRVRPSREQLKDNVIGLRQKQYWWRFWADRPELYRDLAHLKRCLVTSRVSKHLCFSFQPIDRIFSDRLYVFVAEDWSFYAVLQTRMHEHWARLLSSTLEDRLNYSASDCFETFPFPHPDPEPSSPPWKTSASAFTTPVPRSCWTPSRA